MAALDHFDVWNGRKYFARFRIDCAMGFRAHLDRAKGTNGRPLGKSTTRAIMATLREFTLWLSQQDGYRSRIKPGDADYFRLSRRDEAEARAAPERPAPSVRQARRALSMMPATTPREQRDRAVVALLCLTGIRVSALVSLRIKHVDLADKSVTQDPREVAIKFGKRMDTFFAKGFDDAEAVLSEWLTHLDEVEIYGPDDPLFPATAVIPRANSGFRASVFDRRPWRSTEPVRKIVREAFEAAGVPNYGPHAFRRMLARCSEKRPVGRRTGRHVSEPRSQRCADDPSQLRPDRPRPPKGADHRPD